jgi:hypothetical protein
MKQHGHHTRDQHDHCQILNETDGVHGVGLLFEQGKKSTSRVGITLEKGLLKGNTATSGRKAVQYMETDRSRRDGSHPPGVPITVGLKS